MKIHIDIDSFFISAERIKDPSLKNIPSAVGGRSDANIFKTNAYSQGVNFNNSGSFVGSFYERYAPEVTTNTNDRLAPFRDAQGRVRGILTTSSYEARAFGITTAMSIQQALRLCPHLIIKTPDMPYYQKLSHQLHTFLIKKVPKIEQASIDEFYGDLEGWIEDEDISTFIHTLQLEILEEIKLPVSIGASYTKSIAKLATTSAKPFGCKIVLHHQHYNFVKDVKVESFAGIGKSMQQKLKQYAIHTLGDLLAAKELVENISPYAKELYKRVEGSDREQVKSNRVRKSIGLARTFESILCRKELHRRVLILTRHLAFAIMKLAVFPTTYHLTISYSGNQDSSANLSSNEMFNEPHLQSVMVKLYMKSDLYKNMKVIRISMSASNFTHTAKRELSLINFDEAQKAHKFSKVLFNLRSRYGLNILKFGGEF